MAQMNFLQIIQRAYREMGLTGSGPVSSLNQSGRNADVVNWVRDAYEEIQSSRPDWNFHWAKGTFSLTAGNDLYDPITNFGISTGVREFARAMSASYSYPTASGVNARLYMRFMPWEEFRGYLIPQANGNQANLFSMRPDGKIQYYPMPVVAQTVVHEYAINNGVLNADESFPILPAWAHMAITWKAAMIGCGRTKDWSRLDTAEEQFEKIYQRMLRECTPEIQLGAPLA